ncbi:MAG: tryptophan synthase subunit beta like protein [Pseudomonadota bacterium]|nr:tryptophan synthase subunit beta like protein [Pseudomonadota bacterium]
MIYVRRNANGQVTALSLTQDTAHPDAMEETAPEVTAFQAAVGGELARSDLALARVLEDLMEILIDKAVIRFTDLPAAAQKKLMARRSLRAEHRGVNLIGDEDSDTV